MNADLKFPIDGSAFCHFMLPYLDDDTVWRLSAIETLANVPALDLGNLWAALQENAVLLSTSELCNVLRNANQIIALAIVDVKDASVKILIEDGEVVVNTLS
jgi:hypothetical protein